MKFRAAPISGYFLEHNDYTGQPGYIDGMHDAFTLHNCTGGVPPRCIAALPLDEQWNCIFANYSYAYRWVRVHNRLPLVAQPATCNQPTNHQLWVPLCAVSLHIIVRLLMRWVCLVTFFLPTRALI